ncbi:MAG: DUF2334 domain-containing protein [Pseudomonadota bacterium]
MLLRIYLVPIFFFISVTTSNLEAFKYDAQKINILLRYDDFSPISSYEIESRLIDILKKNNIPCTIGIIPFSKTIDPYSYKKFDNNKIILLKQAMKDQLITPALHGFSHENRNKGFFLKPSEFYNQNYLNQLDLINKGKLYLEKLLDTSIDIFVPPWNTYDNNTIKALEKLDFQILSAGPIGAIDTKVNLKYIPTTINLDKLDFLINSSKRNNDKNILIHVLFHEFDFLESKNSKGFISLNAFEKLLHYLKSSNINFISLNSSEQPFNKFDAKLYSHFSALNKNLKFLLPFLKKHFDHERYFYIKAATSNNLIIKVFFLLFFQFLIVTIITMVSSFYINIIINNIFKPFIWAIKLFYSILFIISITSFIINDTISYKFLLIFIVILILLLETFLHNRIYLIYTSKLKTDTMKE